MRELDLQGYRRTHTWQVEETEAFAFLIDASLSRTEDILELFHQTDESLGRVLALVGSGSLSLKSQERKRRINVWLYCSDVLAETGIINPEKPRTFYGTVNASGIHLVTHELAWTDPIVVDRVNHEVVHFWWCDEVGEAPSLLNEGVAAHFERILATDPEERSEELRESWERYAKRTKPGFLRRLCNNDTFWSEDSSGQPVYEVGGRLVSYLLQKHGIDCLRQIFLGSHYSDDRLADRIEKAAEESLESIEGSIGAHNGQC